MSIIVKEISVKILCDDEANEKEIYQYNMKLEEREDAILLAKEAINDHLTEKMNKKNI